MNTVSTMLFVLVGAFAFGTGSANAESWSRTYTGPHGGTRAIAGSCADGRCSRSVGSAGPHGATHARTGSCSHAGCRFDAHATGANGASWSRSGGVVHGPRRDYRYRETTGPQGHERRVVRVVHRP